MGHFKDLADRVEHFDNAPFRWAMARVEASKFIGEDGKEYVRFPLATKPSKETGGK